MAKKPSSKKKSADGGESGSFTDFLHTTLDNYPEEGKCPIGRYRFKVKGHKVIEDKGMIMLIHQVVEPVDLGNGAEAELKKLGGVDNLGPIFENFNCNPGQMGVRMLKKRLLDAGVDPSKETIEGIKALTGTEWIGEVQYSPNEKDPKNPYVNVRGLMPA